MNNRNLNWKHGQINNHQICDKQCVMDLYMMAIGKMDVPMGMELWYIGMGVYIKANGKMDCLKVTVYWNQKMADCTLECGPKTKGTDKAS